MFRRPISFLALMAALLLLAGCVPAMRTPPPVARLARQGEPFTLRLGETARLNDADLDISFDSLVVDGRCPKASQCNETAPVQVGVRVQRVGFSVWSVLRLSAHTDSEGRVMGAPTSDTLPANRYGAALISLFSVTPYPVTGKEAASDYAITLLVTPLPAEDAPQQSEPPTPTPLVISPQAALGQPFSVQYGQTAVLDEIKMQITFEKVTKDSRCPLDVNCVWSGVVDVRLRVEMTGQPAEQMTLGGATTGQGDVLGPVVGASGPTAAWYAGYTITLQQVTPYPAHANQPAPLEAYAVTLLAAVAKER